MLKRVLTMTGLLIVVFVTACGGGGGGDATGGVIGGGSTRVSAAFSADTPSGDSDTVATSEQNASGNLVTVNVNVVNTDNVYGASFDVVYDADMADFVEHAAGEILERGGNSPFYQVQEVSPGRLVVVATRTGSVAPVDVTGTDTLIQLTFRVTSAASGRLDFENANISDEQPQNVSIQEWAGGTLSGT